MGETERLTRATDGLPAPLAVVDLDVFDANAASLLSRAGGTPVPWPPSRCGCAR